MPLLPVRFHGWKVESMEAEKQCKIRRAASLAMTNRFVDASYQRFSEIDEAKNKTIAPCRPP